MCKGADEGGQRCAAHTRKILNAARERADAANDAVKNAPEMMTLGEWDALLEERRNAGEALFQAHVEHASTPTGQRELRAALAAAQANGDGFAAMQASGLLQRGQELRERNQAIKAAVKDAAAAKKATAATPASSAGDRAVCNACGWEGPETEAPGGHCPQCAQNEVNYFHPAPGTPSPPQPTRPDGKMVTGDDLAIAGCASFIDPGSGDIVEIHRAHRYNDGWQFDTTDGWAVIVEKGQLVEQVPDGTPTTGETFEEYAADYSAEHHPNAIPQHTFENDYAPVEYDGEPMLDDPPTDADPKTVWTIVEGEHNYLYAVPGVQHVNAVGYIETTKAWVTGKEEAIWIDGSQYSD